MTCDPGCEFEPRYHTKKTPPVLAAEQLSEFSNMDDDAFHKTIELLTAVEEVYVYDICPTCGDVVRPVPLVTTPEEKLPAPEPPIEPWHTFDKGLAERGPY